MSFKKRLVTLGLMGVFVAVVLTISLYSIFANGNLLVKTNVSVYYTGISLDDAYVATNTWRMGDEGKTEILALTNANLATEASNIASTLTIDNHYVVYEIVLENRSATERYYLQVTYENDETEDSNMYIKSGASVGDPLEVDEVLSLELNEIVDFYWKGPTRICNNVVAEHGQTVYVYIVVGVKDLKYSGKFGGDFACNISMDEFDNTPQVSVKYDGKGVSGYYVEMGEMPQSYAGTNDSLYTVTEDVYTECGVEYSIYVDAEQNRYAKKDGKYYKFEPIIWDVLRYGQNSDSINSPNSNYLYLGRDFAKKYSSGLFLISRNVIFNSVWHNSLTRVNYTNSTIYANINEFYNNVMIAYDKLFGVYTANYNNVEKKAYTELKDYSDVSVSLKISLFNMIQTDWLVNKVAGAVETTVYSTPWAGGTESASVASFWSRTNQYNSADGEIFVAGLASGQDLTVTATNINESNGVRLVLLGNF